MPAAASLVEVHKRFGDLSVLTGFNLELPFGQVTGLIGPSGVGKTTVGRLLLGLERPDAGELIVRVGTKAAVFQEDRLCEHLTAVSNVMLVLGRRRATKIWFKRQRVRRAAAEDKPPSADLLDDETPREQLIRQTVAALTAVGLGDRLAVPVRELSGGQRRRVALVRALLAPAELLVLDEPFTGLDQTAHDEVIDWVATKLVGRTALLISHDLQDVERLAAQTVAMGR